MIDIKKFSGTLNKDDLEEQILPDQHTSAANIVFKGGQNGRTAFNVKGNVVVSNSNLPAGTNECIGAFYDQLRQRIIWFNFNSNGNHGLYQYMIETGLITQIFRSGVNSATDILNFNRNYPIHSSALVYRGEDEGDLLYWTDGLNRPRYLNLLSSSITTLSPFTENMINAAKIPPLIPPQSVAYTSDATFDANRVKNKYFQFSYRWVYQNFEKSTFAPWSVVPIPANTIFPQQDIATNTNNVINFSVLSAATEDFTAVEIVGREWLGTAWSDFFLIQTVTQADVGTALPWTYSYDFYNNGTYAPIATDDSDLYFDWLPDLANTLELLNGNVIIYGGITEGYDPLTRQDVDVQITSQLINSVTYPAVSGAHKWNQYYQYGLQYFDKYAKPIGGVVSFKANSAIDTTNFDVTTPEYIGGPSGSYWVPKIFTTINHLPPDDAESYCWVRQNLLPTFLQWVTNDYQTDAEYLYLCIQSLIDANTRNGFIPSYEFQQGDRVRVIAKFFATENTTVFTTQLDYEILSVVQRTMGSGNPAQNGAFLKVKRPTVFPGPTPYDRNMLIEIYTPAAGLTSNTTPFYEFGQRYGFTTILGQKYHNGNIQNQTAALPALTDWITEGDVYLKTRQIYPTIGAATYTLMVQDVRYNDFQNSAANSNGRIWLIDPNAKQEYNGVLVRWGGRFQAGTNINNLNRFRPNDFDEADRGKGDIRRFKARDRILREFQDRGVGQWGIYARFIQNNEGVPELVTTNEIITTNNIQYYQGVFGLGGYPTNLASSAIADYFVDLVTGREIRLSGDGMTDLGDLYKGRFYFPALVVPYNKEILQSNGTISKVMKFFDSFEGEAHTILQGGTLAGAAVASQHYSFNEPRNSFCCDSYNYTPEWALSAADIIYSWVAGALWKHDSSTYCNFYGTQYDAHVTTIFNRNLEEKKSWHSIAEEASDTWDCPVIGTNVSTYGTTKQSTNLIAAEFTLLEGMPTASIKRDANSNGAKVNGNFIKGNWMSVKFRKQNASSLISLSSVMVRFTDSPLTPNQ